MGRKTADWQWWHWVVATLAALAASGSIAGVMFFQRIVQSRAGTAQAAQQTAAAIVHNRGLIHAFHGAHGAPPRSLRELGTDAKLEDAWGRPFLFVTTSSGRVEISSMGADGAVGGIAEAGDLRGVFELDAAGGDRWLVHPGEALAKK